MQDVVLRPLFVLQFDRILAPSSVSRPNYRLTSGKSGELAFKQVRVDPVERTVVFNLDRPLEPSTEYQLSIKAADRVADRLAAFDGTPFEGETVVRFTTLAKSTVEETDIDPVAADPCVALSVLQATCAGSACHGQVGVPAKDLVAPAMGLSLVSERAVNETAIGRSAVQVQLAADPASTGGATGAFPYGLPLIAPHDASRSYLLYKILLDDRRDLSAYDGGLPPPHPTLAVGDPSANPFPAMAHDLAQHVPGAPMPHPTLQPEPGSLPYGAMPLENVRLLRAWIDQGAVGCGGSIGDAGTSDGGDAAVDAATDATTD